MAHINVSVMGPHGNGADDHPFQNAVGVSFQQAPVHVGPGIPFIGIANNVSIPFVPGARRPFDARGKSAAPPAP